VHRVQADEQAEQVRGFVVARPHHGVVADLQGAVDDVAHHLGG